MAKTAKLQSCEQQTYQLRHYRILLEMSKPFVGMIEA
jgi:hypothetical protein